MSEIDERLLSILVAGEKGGRKYKGMKVQDRGRTGWRTLPALLPSHLLDQVGSPKALA